MLLNTTSLGIHLFFLAFYLFSLHFCYLFQYASFYYVLDSNRLYYLDKPMYTAPAIALATTTALATNRKDDDDGCGSNADPLNCNRVPMYSILCRPQFLLLAYFSMEILITYASIENRVIYFI